MSQSDLMTLERQEQIVAQVNELGRLTVSELSERFGVSETTIRRDLTALVGRNLIQRTHGGAIRLGTVVTFEVPIIHRQSEHAAEKERIGAATAALIHNGETLLIVGGSTGFAVAKNLDQHQNLTIITESILVAQELLQHGQHKVIMLGGTINPDEYAVRGPLARQMVEQFTVDKVIIGARAVSVKRGISTESPEEADLLKAFFQRSDDVILVTDSSKFHISALTVLTSLSAVNTLITDEGLNMEIRHQIQELGIHLITV